MPPHREQGAALLSVLILVGIMGAIAVSVFDRLRLATSLARNALAQDNAHSLSLVAQTLLTTRIDDLLALPARSGDWQGKMVQLPLPSGSARAQLRDGASCFNLNSLVTASQPGDDGNAVLVTRPAAVQQFTALLVLLGIGDSPARRLAGATADWIDSDTIIGPDGAEDESYARAGLAFRTGNTIFAEASEWRAVLGVDAVYTQVRPWLCALPVAELSPINVNALTPAQAPLLAMLLPPQAGIAAARSALQERPRGGWPNVQAFWNTPTLRGVDPVGDAITQVRVRTSWLTMQLDIAAAGTDLVETALIDARQPPSRVVARRWTEDE